MTEDAASGPLDEASLCALFQAHRDGLAGAARGVLGARADVHEVVQDALWNALRSLRKRGPPRDAAAWIFVVTLNVAKDHRRRARRRTPARSLEDGDVADMQLVAKERPVGARLETAEAVAAARRAIERLGDAEKDVFLLRTSGELTFEAAAAALGIPVGTAKTRMRAALAHLRRELAAFAPAGPDARERDRDVDRDGVAAPRRVNADRGDDSQHQHQNQHGAATPRRTAT